VGKRRELTENPSGTEFIEEFLNGAWRRNKRRRIGRSRWNIRVTGCRMRSVAWAATEAWRTVETAKARTVEGQARADRRARTESADTNHIGNASIAFAATAGRSEIGRKKPRKPGKGALNGGTKEMNRSKEHQEKKPKEKVENRGS
jgi:hypothetical protein